jgi:hypothetical protein
VRVKGGEGRRGVDGWLVNEKKRVRGWDGKM